VRGGGERRLRHDVSAKAKNLANAQCARDLVDDAHLQALAYKLVCDTAGKALDTVDDALLSAIAHELVRRALLRRPLPDLNES
jgi:hypothetical protein